MTSKKPAEKTAKRIIHAPIEAVFKAFVEPPTLREWLGAELDLVLELNGKYCVTAPDTEPGKGTIEIIAWPEQLAITWADARFDLNLSAQFGGTEAVLTTTNAPLWDDALARLNAYLQRPGRR